MTMGWHTVMEFTPALIGCVISSANHSFELIRRSEECVINLPTTKHTTQVVVAPTPKHPQTAHYTGDGVFMVAGEIISRRSQFEPQNLWLLLQRFDTYRQTADTLGGASLATM